MGCLCGKVAIITGASTGMGRAIAIAMAAEGASLGLVARSADRLEEAASLARAKGADVLTFPGDVADKEFIKRVVQAMMDGFSRIDILVNNAGTNTYHRNLADTSAVAGNASSIPISPVLSCSAATSCLACEGPERGKSSTSPQAPVCSRARPPGWLTPPRSMLSIPSPARSTSRSGAMAFAPASSPRGKRTPQT